MTYIGILRQLVKFRQELRKGNLVFDDDGDQIIEIVQDTHNRIVYSLIAGDESRYHLVGKGCNHNFTGGLLLKWTVKEPTHALIPLPRLQQLEQARVELSGLLEELHPNDIGIKVLFSNISNAMWQLTHRKFEKECKEELVEKKSNGLL